jgi:tRNA pseudouridine13 synthase
VPAYFGSQRFGREAGNLEAVAAWCGGGPLPRDRDQRGFILSAARSLLFNAVLAERVRRGDWDRLLDGEVVNLDGTGSVFLAAEVDEPLRERCLAMDVHPTGPLAGEGGLEPSGEAAEAEARALAHFAGIQQALSAAGVEASRRALRTPVRGLDWTVAGDVVTVSFELGRGAFATSVLREVLDFAGEDLPAAED